MENRKSGLSGKAARIALLAAFAALAVAYWTACRMDGDSVYMIAEGRRILEAGAIPEEHGFLMYEGARVVIQQWIWCVLLALADRAPMNLGLAAMVLGNAALLFVLLRRRLGKGAPDVPPMLLDVAAYLLMWSVPRYSFSLRPEHVTLSLVLLQCAAMDAYRDTGHRRWLLAPPLLMLLEANLHSSMVIFHLCIWAAYLIKLPIPMADGDRIRPGPAVLASIAATAAAAFLNPYGAAGAFYAFDSMESFSYVIVAEQQRTAIMTLPGLCLLAFIILSVTAAYRRMLPYRALNICAGFGLLAATSYHAAMFLPVAAAFLLQPMLSELDLRGVRKDVMDAVHALGKPFALALAGALIMAVAIPVSIASELVADVKSGPEDPAVEYLLSLPPGRTLNDANIGSKLEYLGLDNIWMDTRPEMGLVSFNGVKAVMPDCLYLAMCMAPADGSPEYESYGAWLDAEGIDYILNQDGIFTALGGWLEASPDWEKHTFGADGGTPSSHAVWTRKEAAPDAE